MTPNVLAYTSSGSGPVNALVQGEAAIGLAMTAQTVTEINNGADLEILFFDEGSPYALYGITMIKGKEERACVREVFDYMVNTLIPIDKERYFPEKIYKDKDFIVQNYPSDIQYADMSNDTACLLYTSRWLPSCWTSVRITPSISLRCWIKRCSTWGTAARLRRIMSWMRWPPRRIPPIEK